MALSDNGQGDSVIIKWRDIAAKVEAEICGGKYPPDKPLPSEPALARRFKAARGTVRLALDELRRKGAVVSRRGSGTYIRARKGSGRLGLLIPDNSAAQIFQGFTRHFSILGQRHGYVFILGDIEDGSPSKRMRAVKLVVRNFISQRVEGVIFRPFIDGRMSRANREIVKKLNASGIPVVLLDSDIVESPARSRCDLVGINNIEVGRRIGDYLVSIGRRRIAFLMNGHFMGPSVNWRNRMFGVMGAVISAGLKWSKKNVIDARPDDIDGIRSAFCSGMSPDAIVCGNDQEAAVLMPTLAALGKRIPEDVAVVGFDDVFCAQLCTPKLTTIHQPIELIAEAALGFLVSRIADAATPAREVTIDAPLIRRGSTEKVV